MTLYADAGYQGPKFQTAMAGVLRDRLRVTHTLADVIRARILAIVMGYEDADYLNHLRHDPALKR